MEQHSKINELEIQLTQLQLLHQGCSLILQYLEGFKLDFAKKRKETTKIKSIENCICGIKTTIKETVYRSKPLMRVDGDLALIINNPQLLLDSDKRLTLIANIEKQLAMAIESLNNQIIQIAQSTAIQQNILKENIMQKRNQCPGVGDTSKVYKSLDIAKVQELLQEN